MIGAKNPVNDVYYARLNKEPRIYTVEYTVGDVASPTLLDLRDKKLTDFSSEKAETVDLSTSAHSPVPEGRRGVENEEARRIAGLGQPSDFPAILTRSVASFRIYRPACFGSFDIRTSEA